MQTQPPFKVFWQPLLNQLPETQGVSIGRAVDTYPFNVAR